MDALIALLKDFDPAKIMPDLSTLLGKVELAMRIAVMVAPLVLLALGLLYFLAPPKEANFKLGYRCFWGMSSVQSWQFTQHLAGIVWSVMGLGLCIAMALLSVKFREMDVETMAMTAGKYLLIELGLILVSIVAINITVIVCFDFKGNLRRFLRKPTPPAEESPAGEQQ